MTHDQKRAVLETMGYRFEPTGGKIFSVGVHMLDKSFISYDIQTAVFSAWERYIDNCGGSQNEKVQTNTQDKPNVSAIG